MSITGIVSNGSQPGSSKKKIVNVSIGKVCEISSWHI
ncbi:hypothetical protein Gotur_029563 [Gossypium turneri]